MTTADEKRVYAAVAERAQNQCEACGYACLPEHGHRDHFFGRRQGTTLQAVWLLCPTCDFAKTANTPSAARWLRVFCDHATRYGYAPEWERAQTKLAVLAVKFPPKEQSHV